MKIKPSIIVLDGSTLGEDISYDSIRENGALTVYPVTAPTQVSERIAGADVVIVNKVRLCKENLATAHSLKLICVAATGYDNIDVEYCRTRGIAVCNVCGYSTNSVAQLTVAMVLELVLHLHEMHDFVQSGAYTASGVANRLTPVSHELAGKTWGIVGAGNIGKKVAEIASALGCRVLVCRRREDPNYPTVDIDTICKEADVLSVHTPLNRETRGLISRERLTIMKNGVILVNVARGAVCDEAALAEFVQNGKLGGLGIDVYSEEPLPESHPLYAVRSFPNVCFTPHMAWGTAEARQRCVDEMATNISTFFAGGTRNRLDI